MSKLSTETWRSNSRKLMMYAKLDKRGEAPTRLTDREIDKIRDNFKIAGASITPSRLYLLVEISPEFAPRLRAMFPFVRKATLLDHRHLTYHKGGPAPLKSRIFQKPRLRQIRQADMDSALPVNYQTMRYWRSLAQATYF